MRPERPDALLSELTPRQSTLMAIPDCGMSSTEPTESGPFSFGHHPIELDNGSGPSWGLSTAVRYE